MGSRDSRTPNRSPTKGVPPPSRSSVEPRSGSRHNGKVERYQRILAEELLYAREFASEDARTSAIAVWNMHYNYHRPHSGSGGRPPASRLRAGVTNVQPSYI